MILYDAYFAFDQKIFAVARAFFAACKNFPMAMTSSDLCYRRNGGSVATLQVGRDRLAG
jgi:hypothetical protein